ncbi:hypothetical protein LIP_1454 [Limnochorda pilosa]|uniref:Uncharacterized protein n=1 Tax=Limnochorda pilosa TaxID=1555112 RepID=A0A0K2SJL3_LIMPI|nr:hypothetical protein LIP_1454 [Limnochorda pilosa]
MEPGAVDTAGLVIPTRVGVNRLPLSRPFLHQRDPHARGGEPALNGDIHEIKE